MGEILLVDDDALSLDLLDQELSDAGYETITAEGGEQALELVKEGDIDLVLLDIMMPRVSGIEVLREVRREHSIADLPVIMVTAKDHSADIVQSLSYGANDYVTKPIDFAVLLARIRTQLHLKWLSDMKDEFMKMATHDLNAPLMAVMAGSSLVLDTLPVGEPMTDDMRRVLARVLARSTDMHRIVSDFLEFHAVEDGGIRIRKERGDLAPIIRNVAEGSEYHCRLRQIELELDFDTGLPKVAMDRDRVQQVVQNLLHNAIKFSEGGGKIVVRTRTGDGGVIVEIEDSGPGLTEEEMGKVFEKPDRLRPATADGEKSFGFGLAISRKLVALHDGEIGVRNNTAKGATFWFRLPME